jgi:hypothetical protein
VPQEQAKITPEVCKEAGGVVGVVEFLVVVAAARVEKNVCYPFVVWLNLEPNSTLVTPMQDAGR